MFDLREFFSKANRSSRKFRHARIRGQLKQFEKKKISGTALRSKSAEKEFFWKIVSLGTFLFFVGSILPNFVSTEPDFWLPVEASSYLIEDQKETIALADEGFLMKPDVHTEVKSREKITDIIEITVEAGDTVSTIAQRFGISVATIVQNNDLANANRLKSGQVLTILPVDGLLYEIKKNETISKIAKNNNVDKKKIITQNNLDEDQELKIGQKIILPGVVKKIPPKVIASGGAYASVPSGISSGAELGGSLFFPCQGKYTQFYHYGHYAVDVAQNGGSPIWAAESGTVIKAQGGWNGGYGNVVIIDHGNGMKTLYAHQREIYVNVGQQVGRGQAIGYMGNTGRVYGRTGIHLHFEVIVNGTKKNPVAYF